MISTIVVIFPQALERICNTCRAQEARSSLTKQNVVASALVERQNLGLVLLEAIYRRLEM